MNIKSVSPIIAVVLLISATIAIGTILMAWGSGLIQEKQSVSEETSESVFGNENYLSIDNLADSNGTLVIWVRNAGDEDVSVENFRIYIKKNGVEQTPQNVSGSTIPSKDTIELAEIPLSLEEGDTVSVKITTKSGYVMTKTLNLTPEATSTTTPGPTSTPPDNQPPTADFSYSPASPDTGDTIQFTDQSTDPDGSIVSWDWNFGDGNSSSDQNPTHSYDDDGTYTVTLTVTDDDGATDDYSEDITVQNQSPTADFDYTPTSPLTYETINFDGTLSSDPDGSISSYEWDWTSDGIFDATGSNPSHFYTDDGTYTVTLRVTDDDGATDTYSDEITVQNQGPTADANGPYAGDVGETITFDGTGSSDPDGTINSYAWDMDNDGSYDDATGSQPTYSWSSEGTYTIGLEVTDDDGAINTDTATVYIGGVEYNNDAVAVDGPDSGTTPGGVEFSITNTYDATITIDSIKIDPLNDNINELDDDYGGGNDDPGEVEIYAEASIGQDSYSDWGTGGNDYEALAIDDSGVEVAVGIDGDNTNSGNLPQVESGGTLTWYLYEFYEDGHPVWPYRFNTNLDMNGESIEITLTYTVDGMQLTKTFTITP